MILQGPSIKVQSATMKNQAVTSLSQLIQFSCKRKRSSSASHYHHKDNETPLPIYLGLQIHGSTWNQTLVDTLFSLGLSILCQHVLAISTDAANSSISLFVTERVVGLCPTPLRKNLFTKCAVDNLGHNPSSATAKSSFHGTSVSMFQDITASHKGQERVSGLTADVLGKKSIDPLPEFCSIVPATALVRNEPFSFIPR